MTSPGGREVGRVSVRVVPDTSKFREELRKELASIKDLDVNVVPDAQQFRERLREIIQTAEAGTRVEVPVEFDQNQLEQAAQGLREALGNTNMPNFLNDMSRLDQVMSRVNDNATRIRSSLERSSRSVVDWTRSAVNVRSHFEGISRTVRNLRGHIGLIRFGNVSADANSAERSVSRLGSTGTSVLSSIGSGLRTAFSAVGTQVSRTFSDIGDAISQMGSSIPSMVVGLIKIGAMSAGLAVAGAGITAAWGAVSTAIFAIPAAIALLAGPIAAVMLGMDGIEKAAQTLKPEFDKLKQGVSDVFEKQLTPVFERLKKVFPDLQKGLEGTATSLSTVAGKLTDFVTKDEQLGLLRTTFDNINAAITDMSPGLTNIVSGVLKLTAQKGAFDLLTSTVNEFGGAFNRAVDEVTADGTLQKAFDGLKGVLKELSQGFIDLGKNGLAAFSTASPGIERFVGSLRGFFNEFDWEELGKSVGKVFDGLGESLDRVDPQTIRDIQGAFGELGDLFKDPAFQGDLAKMVDGLPAAILTLKDFAKDFAAAGALASDGLKAWNTVDTKFRGAVDGIMTSIGDLGKKLGIGEGSSLSEWLIEQDDTIDRWLGILPPKTEDLMTKTGDAARRGTRGGGGSFGGVPGDVQGELEKVPPAAEKGLSGLPGAVQSGLDPATVALATGLATMAPQVMAAMSGIQTAVTAGLSGITPLFANIGVAASAVGTSFTALGAVIVTGMVSISAAATATLTTINSQFAMFLTTITAFGTSFTAIITLVTAQMTALTTAVTAGMASMQTVVVATLTAMTAGFTAFTSAAMQFVVAITSIVTAVTAGMLIIQTTVTAAMTAIVAVFESQLALITNLWIQAITQWVAAIVAGVAQFVAAIQAGMTTAVASVNAGISQMVSALNAAVPQFFAAGANMGQALADGLNSKLGAVQAAAAALANAAAAATAAAAQIASPSKVFIKLGGFIGEGFAVGIHRSRKHVVSAAKQLFHDLEQYGKAASEAWAPDGWEVNFPDQSSGPARQISRTNITEFQDHTDRDDYGRRFDEICDALRGWNVQIDGNGLAKMVNKSNTRRNRRG